MDKRLMDVLETALTERFGVAYMAMQEEREENKEMSKMLADMSQEIMEHPGISSDAKELIQQFLVADSERNADFERYLYIQGAKDSVTVLRELGIIK